MLKHCIAVLFLLGCNFTDVPGKEQIDTSMAARDGGEGYPDSGVHFDTGGAGGGGGDMGRVGDIGGADQGLANPDVQVPLDVGNLDAYVLNDVGAPDAGDVGATDAGDVGAPDAGDVGAPDAGDVGAPDAGDVGAPDASDSGSDIRLRPDAH